MKVSGIIYMIHILTYIMMISGNCFLYLPQEFENSFNKTMLQLKVNTSQLKLYFVNESMFLPISKIHSVMNKYPKIMHISLLSLEASRGMELISRSVGSTFWSFHTGNQDLLHNDNNQLCNELYLESYKSFITFLYDVNIAVVSSPSQTCYHKLANHIFGITLEKAKHKSSNIRLLEKYEINDPSNVSELSGIATTFKLKDITLIVLLIDFEYSELIFKIANNFALNRYRTIWITFGYTYHINWNLDVPWQIIDLSLNHKYNRTFESITNKLEFIVEKFFKVFQCDTILTSYNTTNITVTTSSIRRKSNIDIYARDPTSPNSLIWPKIFTFDTHKKLIPMKEVTLLSRMVNIPSHKTKLRVGALVDPPFTIKIWSYYNKNSEPKCEKGLLCKEAVRGLPDNHVNKWEETCCIGMIMDILGIVAKDLQFLFDIYLVEDGFYGGLEHIDGKLQWNGLVKDILMDNIDVAMAPLAPTSSRSKVVDFTEPFMKADISILTGEVRPIISFINWEFLTPLDGNLRWWIVGTFVIGTVLIYILENQDLVLKRITDKEVYARYRWRDGFSYFSGLTFQRDLGGKNPRKAGARVTAVAFAFGMVIIMTTYTAVLTAAKVSRESSNFFQGFRDQKVCELQLLSLHKKSSFQIVNPSNDFRYSTVSYSSASHVFRYSTNPVRQRMYQFMKQFKINNTADGVELVKLNKINAFIYDTMILQHHMSSNCTLKIFGKAIQQSGYAFMLAKGSAWKDLLSQSILKLKHDDRIAALKEKWFPDICKYNSSNNIVYEAVELNYFGGLILVLGLFSLITFGLLGLEHFCYRHHRRLINPIQDKVQVWRDSKMAGRRNALIDPADLQKLQKSFRKKFYVSQNNNNDNSDDEDSVISEGEEELIRMKIANQRRMSKIRTVTSIQSDCSNDTISTISDGTVPPGLTNFTAFRQGSLRDSTDSHRLVMKRSRLFTTHEVSENESDSQHSNDEYDGSVYENHMRSERSNSPGSLSESLRSDKSICSAGNKEACTKNLSRSCSKLTIQPEDEEIKSTDSSKGNENVDDTGWTLRSEPELYDQSLGMVEAPHTKDDEKHKIRSLTSSLSETDSAIYTGSDTSSSDISATTISNEKRNYNYCDLGSITDTPEPKDISKSQCLIYDKHKRLKKIPSFEVDDMKERNTYFVQVKTVSCENDSSKKKENVIACDHENIKNAALLPSVE